MSVKTAGVGHFQIPTAPAAGTSVTSGAANAYTASAVQLIASTAAALYITGVHAEAAAASAATYKSVQLMIGGAGAETNLGQYLVPMSTGSVSALGYRPIFPPIPVASGQRISVKTADSVGAQATLITLECIAQSNVVDDGIAVGTVTTVTNQLTAAAIATGVWQDATAGDFSVASSIGKAVYIANIAPGAAGGHMISGANAGTTTLGALTITGATTLTGNVVLSDGLTVSAPSTGNRAGITVTGNGTGAAVILTGGATGIGLNVVGGGTSGDGIKVTTTSGHGINLAPVGSSVHGIFATGGNAGTSDGIKAAAGTGGVDIRGNITGNLTGTVATLTTYTGNTPQTGDSFARLGAPAGASVSADVAAVNAKTTNLPAAPASTTNITAGTITTTTNLTNLPAIPANWLTAAGIAAAALNGKGDWNIGKTGYALSVAGVQAIWDALTAALTTVGSIGKLLVDNINATISSRAPSATALSTADYTAARAAKLDNADVAVSTRAAAATALSTADYTAARAAKIDNMDVLLSSRLATVGYTAPDNAGIGVAAVAAAASATDAAAIRLKTDSLTFTTPGVLDINILRINGVVIVGDGSGTPFNV